MNAPQPSGRHWLFIRCHCGRILLGTPSRAKRRYGRHWKRVHA